MLSWLAVFGSKTIATILKWIILLGFFIAFLIYFLHLYSYKIKAIEQLKEKDNTIAFQQSMNKNITNQANIAKMELDKINKKINIIKQKPLDKNVKIVDKINCEFTNFDSLEVTC